MIDTSLFDPFFDEYRQLIETLPVDNGGAVALLTVIIVPPGPDFTLIGDGQTMKGADRDVDDLFTHQPLMQTREELFNYCKTLLDLS